MRLSRPVTHVIFDLDGVLLDTEGFYTRVTQTILARYGKTYDWSHKQHMLGRPAIEAVSYLVRALELPITPDDFLLEREARLAALFADSPPMPGAPALVAALAARGVRQAVATSSSGATFAQKTARHADWFARFAAVIVGDDPRVVNGKPAPDIFLVAAAALGAPPAECVVVEDSPAGVAAARAAGMQVIALPDPALERARVADADLVVDSLHEITAVVLGVADGGARRAGRSHDGRPRVGPKV